MSLERWDLEEAGIGRLVVLETSRETEDLSSLGLEGRLEKQMLESFTVLYLEGKTFFRAVVLLGDSFGYCLFGQLSLLNRKTQNQLLGEIKDE